MKSCQKKQGKTITVHALREVTEVNFFIFYKSRPVLRSIYVILYVNIRILFLFLTTNSHMFELRILYVYFSGYSMTENDIFYK